jgi:hypothetical protein
MKPLIADKAAPIDDRETLTVDRKPLIVDKETPVDNKKPPIRQRSTKIRSLKRFDQLSINYLLVIANEIFRTEHSTLQGGDRYG